MVQTHQDLPVVLHNAKRGLLTVEDNVFEVLQLSSDGKPPKKLVSASVRGVLRVRLAPGEEGQQRRLDINTLRSKGTELRLSKMHVLVDPVNVPEAETWVETIMQAAYRGSKMQKRILLLVNPISGKGKSKELVKSTVLPLFEAAGCSVQITETTHRFHAEAIAKEMDLSYDVIATASGDGLMYEVFNGLASRPDARKALRIPVATIPTGSANSVSLNLFGPKDVFNVQLACLTAIKGTPLPIDFVSVLLIPSMERRWSFLQLAIGLMAELDLGTENLRWMGDTRFMVGFLKGVMSSRNHRCRLRMKVEGDDKISMVRQVREAYHEKVEKGAIGAGHDPLRTTNNTTKPKTDAVNGEAGPSKNDSGPSKDRNNESNMEGKEVVNGDHEAELDKPLEEARPLQPDDTWITIDTGYQSSKPNKPPSLTKGKDINPNHWVEGERILYATMGLMPYLDRDLMQFPIALFSPGVIDVVIQSVVPRLTMLNAISGAEKGATYWIDSSHYYKVSALTCENLDKSKQPVFGVDGESYPYDSFHVEVHPKMGHLLTLDGSLYISDFIKHPDARK